MVRRPQLVEDAHVTGRRQVHRVCQSPPDLIRLLENRLRDVEVDGFVGGLPRRDPRRRLRIFDLEESKVVLRPFGPGVGWLSILISLRNTPILGPFRAI